MTSNPYPPFITTVARSQRISSGFVRVTLTGEALGHFATHGLDQRIKLIFELPDGGYGDFGIKDSPAPTLGQWAGRWRALPEGQRNTVRTFTASALRPEQQEIDIDFAVHEPSGPACRWALAAQPGDELIVVGPDARHPDSTGGIDFQPGTARHLLLVADETGIPALRNILNALPAGTTADVFAEAASAEDLATLGMAPDGVRVRALVRSGERGAATVAAVTAWTASDDGVSAVGTPGDGFYAWLVGESTTVKTLRRHLVSSVGLSPAQVTFSGYWKLGAAEN